MKSFNLTKERKARVWLGEFLPSFQTNESSLTEVVKCSGSLYPLHTTVAVELFIPAGGRFFYGLLGIQTFGKETQKTSVEIANFPHRRGSEITDSLAGALDTVVPWIDNEYHAAILAGASTAAGKYAALPERIQIYSGRQGLIGSSQELFHRLGSICVTLLATPEEDIGEKIEKLVTLD